MEKKTYFSLQICVLFSFQGDFCEEKKNHDAFLSYGQEKNTYDEKYTLGKFEININIIHHPKFCGKIPLQPQF